MPSLFTAGISAELAHARATSSMMIAVASASAPSPPYTSGMCAACSPAPVSASRASDGNRAFVSTSAAAGAIFASASSRTVSRSSTCSSGSS